MAAAFTTFYKNDGTGIYTGDLFREFPTVESLGWSRNGYTFASWNTMADGTGSSFAEGSFSPAPDETGYGAYYAIWEPLPPSYLDLEGLSHYTDLIMDEINGKIDIGGKAGAIAYGSVDSTSTDTVFTATLDGITELVDGTTMMLHNGVITSAKNFTININGLGAKKCYSNMTNATQETTIFNVAYTMLFVYSTALDSGNGGWWLYRGYNSNDNTIGYQLRTNSGNKVASDTGYRYRIWLTQADGKKWVPINTSSSTNATSNRTLNTRPIDPFGPIVYRASNGTCSAGAGLGATSIWQQYTLTIGYSYMVSGFSLVAGPVYLRCTPQSDGSAVMQDITQDLPSSKDGKIYILLGTAYSATSMELSIEHPVYWYDGAGIRLWMGAEPSGANGFSPTVSVSPITGGHEVTITDADGAHSFDVMDGSGGDVPEDLTDKVDHLWGNRLIGSMGGTVSSVDDAYAACPETLDVYGASTQAGTPTPDAPVPIQSVDELTVLFGGANLRLPESGATVGKFLDKNGDEVANTNWRYTTYLPVIDGKVTVYSGYNQTIRTGASSRSYWYDASKGKVGPQTVGYGTLVAQRMYEWTLTAPEGAAFIRISIQGSNPLYQGTHTTIDLQGHQLRSLPDGTRDTLNLSYLRPSATVGRAVYSRTLTALIGETTTAATDGITGTIGVDVMSTTSEIADGPTVLYKLATPIVTTLDPIELPIPPAPNCTVWCDGGSATPTYSMEYVRDTNIVIANLEAALADLVTS